MYRQYSKQLMTLLRTFTPDIEQLSIDECFWTLHRSPINMNLRLPEPPLFLRLSKSNSALPLTSGSHRISCSLRWQVILKNQTASTRSGKKRSEKTLAASYRGPLYGRKIQFYQTSFSWDHNDRRTRTYRQRFFNAGIQKPWAAHVGICQRNRSPQKSTALLKN